MLAKVIKHYEALQKRYTSTHNGKMCEITAFTIDILKSHLGKDKSLTLEELKLLDGKPVFYVTLPEWLTVDEECEEERLWGVCRIRYNHWFAAENHMPWAWEESNYGKYWVAYTTEIKKEISNYK